MIFENKKVSECVIKFIDIIIDLYSPILSEVRNQMRILQTTLLYGKNNDLDEHIASLEQKLKLKENTRMKLRSTPYLHHNVSAEIDKQNKPYLGNQYKLTTNQPTSIENRINASLKEQKSHSVSNLKENVTQQAKHLFANQNYYEFHDLEQSSMKYKLPNIPKNNQNKLDENKENKFQQLQTKLPTKTFLKIVKKNKSQKSHSLTSRTLRSERSFTQKNIDYLQYAKSMLQEIQKNDIQFNKMSYLQDENNYQSEMWY